MLPSCESPGKVSKGKSVVPGWKQMSEIEDIVPSLRGGDVRFSAFSVQLYLQGMLGFGAFQMI